LKILVCGLKENGFYGVIVASWTKYGPKKLNQDLIEYMRAHNGLL